MAGPRKRIARIRVSKPGPARRAKSNRPALLGAVNDGRVWLVGPPVTALKFWIERADIRKGPVFRAIDRWAPSKTKALTPPVGELDPQTPPRRRRPRSAGFSAHGLRRRSSSWSCQAEAPGRAGGPQPGSAGSPGRGEGWLTLQRWRGREPAADGPARMRTVRPQEPIFAELVGDLGRHAVPRVGFAPRRIPQMVRNEFQKQRLSDRPGHGHSCRGQRSGLEIGKVGSEGAQRVLAHAPAGQVLQDLDVAVGEELDQTLESRFGRGVMPTLEG
jgi:hypothetical protein